MGHLLGSGELVKLPVCCDAYFYNGTHDPDCKGDQMPTCVLCHGPIAKGHETPHGRGLAHEACVEIKDLNPDHRFNQTNKREPHLLKTKVIEGLSPGIRDLVLLLNAQGFQTVDSGDGSNHGKMGCAPPFPMVAILTTPASMVGDATDIHRFLKKRGVKLTPPAPRCGRAEMDFNEDMKFPQVQAQYDPEDGIATITIFNVLSKDVVAP